MAAALVLAHHARSALHALGQLAYHTLALLALGMVACAMGARALARRLPPSKRGTKALAHAPSRPTHQQVLHLHVHLGTPPPGGYPGTHE